MTAAWRANQPDTQSPAIVPPALLSEEQDPASDDFEEPEVHRSSCYCRTCQGNLELVGRLKGTETKAMQSLAQNIVFRMLSIFTEVASVGYNELLFQLRIAFEHNPAALKCIIAITIASSTGLMVISDPQIAH